MTQSVGFLRNKLSNLLREMNVTCEERGLHALDLCFPEYNNLCGLTSYK